MTHAEGSPPPVGIVIVTYHSALHIGECLAAARRCAAQIVVVDNASQDGTRDEVLRMGVKLIANPTNRGFAAAVNQGIRALDTSYLLLLNPDAVIQKGIDALQACCAEPGVAAAGGKLVDAEGRPQVGFMVRRFPSPAVLVFEALLINRLWPGNPVNRRYRCADLDFSVPQDVDQPAGAFLMFRREVWHKLGGLDERFSPLWFEDVDFCRRIRDAGYHIRYTPDAVAKHTGGHSLSSLTLEIRTLYWYGSFLRYTARHFRPWQRRLVSLAVLIGAFLRMIASAAMSRTLKSTAVYGEVISLAGRYFVSGRLQDE